MLDIFEKENVPRLDLHTENNLNIEDDIGAFLKSSFKSGEEVVKIVHGIGSGAMKKRVHDILNEREQFLEFIIEDIHQSISNPGETLVSLKGR